MRKFLFIFVAILAYLLLCSKSCGSDEKDDSAKQAAELTQTKVSIKNEFESDNLSKKSLRAFEVKAKQKLVDFSDYLDIYSDKQMDESFKSQARQMILDIFMSDTIRVTTLLLQESNAKYFQITEFLSSSSASGYNSMDFIFDSIEVAAPLLRTDNFNYKGRLSFSRRVKISSASDTLFTGPDRMEVDIFASKVRKQFGSDTLQIWSVFLGDIR